MYVIIEGVEKILIRSEDVTSEHSEKHLRTQLPCIKGKIFSSERIKSGEDIVPGVYQEIRFSRRSKDLFLFKKNGLIIAINPDSAEKTLLKFLKH